MIPNLEIIILAAGLGTRMKSEKPKVLFEISGMAMIDHILTNSLEISDKISVVLMHQADKIKNHISKKFTDINFHIQDINKPGTAGALMGYDFRADEILVICGDTPMIDKKSLISLINKKSDINLAAFNKKNPKGYGRLIVENKKLLKIIEEKDANEEEKKVKLVNAGAYYFKKSALEKILPLIENKNTQKEYYLTDCIKIAKKLNLKTTFSIVNKDNFTGVNDKYQLNLLEQKMQKKIKKNLMQNGVLMQNPKSIFIDTKAKFIGECILESGVQIKGECKIENSHIKAFSYIEDSTIKDSTIGPMAHLRPNSKIINSKIGNFVEIKASNLNEVKASHLSYIGDCDIDSGTNIGCGFIACNYDGKKKYKSKIGKNVFIGSNTKLIAPINLADESMTAAGSVIGKDLKSGELGICKIKQQNIENFYYKFFKKDKEK